MSRKDECYRYWRDLESAGLPDENDRKLRFLAYGFFKPHQLAHSQIKNFIDDTPEPIDINYELKNVNGMPVLLDETSRMSVDASLIRFKSDKQYKAYRTIGFSKNMHIYSWKVITIENQDGECEDVNVLMYPDDETFPEISSEFLHNTYDWRNDPVFKDTFEYLDWQINGLKKMPFKYQWDDLKPLIGVQALYMALWSAIDRFMSFRYGDTQTWNVKKLSMEPSFRKSLKKNHNAIGKRGFYQDRNADVKKEIFSTEDLESYHLDPSKPTCSALYYYHLRNNVVHSSKVIPDEVDTVWNALLGLKNIFQDVIDTVENE